MNKEEVHGLLKERLRELRGVSYDELKKLSPEAPDVREVTGPSGARYFVETEAWPDDPKTGNLRVMVSIYDDRSLLRSIFPLTSGFIVAPDGRFVDE